MAADLPEMRHPDGLSMAKALVTYMTDERAIQLAVRSEFDCTQRGISLTTIRQLRKAHLESLLKPAERPHKPHEGHDPAAAARKLEDANKRFLEALERERAISADLSRSMGALDSPALRRPDIVNRAWEREIEAARALNGEFGQ
jgi:hypothetical protein